MEIIVEIAIQIAGWLLQFLAELLLQLVFEAMAGALGHVLKEPFRRPRPRQPVVAAIGYLVSGAMADGLTLWLVPELFIKARWLRAANLMLAPLAAGLVMQAMGSWRARRDKPVLGLESFAYGFCFAFGMALVRFTFGR